MADLRTRIADAKFHLANWLFRKLDRWLDHYLDGLSEERLEELYQQAVRAERLCGEQIDRSNRLADIDLDPNPFRRTGTDAERQWQQADDKTTTKFRVTANVYPSPFAEKTCAVATWTGTRFQIGEMAGEYADESDNPLLHMEIGTVEVLDD